MLLYNRALVWVLCFSVMQMHRNKGRVIKCIL